MQFRYIFRAFATAIALAGAGSASAQDAASYPDRPITMVVPFAPGGASDFAARLLQPRLSEILGQQVVIENKDGAAGNVGMLAASRAAPDGYTLFFGNVGTISVNPHVFANLNLDPLDAFVPVSIVADAPGVMIATPSFPPNNIKELIDYSKANPGKVNFASAGASSINRLEMESFRKQAGLDMVHVPYKGGAGQAIADVIGGHVGLMFTSIGQTVSQIKDGRLKALAVTTTERVPSLPDVATMPEQGFPKNVSSSWQGVFAIKGTPDEIVQKLHRAIVEAMKDPLIIERMGQSGVIAVSSPTTSQYAEFLQKDSEKWKAVVTEIGLKFD